MSRLTLSELLLQLKSTWFTSWLTSLLIDIVILADGNIVQNKRRVNEFADFSWLTQSDLVLQSWKSSFEASEYFFYRHTGALKCCI